MTKKVLPIPKKMGIKGANIMRKNYYVRKFASVFLEYTPGEEEADDFLDIATGPFHGYFPDEEEETFDTLEEAEKRMEELLADMRPMWVYPEDGRLVARLDGAYLRIEDEDGNLDTIEEEIRFKE